MILVYLNAVTTRRMEPVMKNNNNDFVKSIVKYYMDFIESDFHRRRTPKRKIVFTKPDNLVVGCNLSAFDKFDKLIMKNLKQEYKTNNVIDIHEGIYPTSINPSAMKKIHQFIEQKCIKSLSVLQKNISNKINKLDNSKNMIEAVFMESVIEIVRMEVESILVRPFLEDAGKTLQDIGVVSEDNILISESLVDEISNLAIDTIRNSKRDKIFTEIYTNEKDVVRVVDDYFGSFAVSDLYSVVGKMNSSKKLLDKQDVYLSIFDLTYNNEKYPIFYIPVELEENQKGFSLKLDARLYINKKAIEYIAQETKDILNLVGQIQSIRERILYMAEMSNPMYGIKTIVREIISYFGMPGDLDVFIEERKPLKNGVVTIGASTYLNVFDRSDDALVNDYEELLQHLNDPNSELAEEFEGIIKGFMFENPISVISDVEERWDNTSLSDKLTFQAPVPLNEEQIKILNALNNEKCKHVIVQGPPGTGKSHTITAIIFDMILKNKSILVLSDKKEALDVVEDKITSTLNKVRTGDDFQNPILRLGKSGSTYGKILSQSSMQNIRINYNVLKSDKDKINQEIETRIQELTEAIEIEKTIGDKIKVSDILEFEMIENLMENNKDIDLDEIEKTSFINDYMEINSLIEKFSHKKFAKDINEIAEIYGLSLRGNEVQKEYLVNLKERIMLYDDTMTKAIKDTQVSKDIIINFEGFNTEKLNIIIRLINEYTLLKKKFFGFVFYRKKLTILLDNLQEILPWFVRKNHVENVNEIRKVLLFREEMVKKIPHKSINFSFLVDVIKTNVISSQISYIDKALMDIKKLNDYRCQYPKNLKKLNMVNVEDVKRFKNSFPRKSLEEASRFVELKSKLQSDFSVLKSSGFIDNKKALQENITLQTIELLDSRVLNFYHNNKNTATTLKKIIQRKSKFPKDDFNKLKEAFPCILASVRDYAEYIPLERNIFDLIIIDEASQVSIAQAMPALIRGKKILVLGDKMQFSNVKSNLAKTEINTEYKSHVKEGYKNSEYYTNSHEIKLENFDIRSSVLEFFEFTANYNTMLNKYFRGYNEIISYSNTKFYNNKLQIMKIRGKNIDDVLRFTQVDHDGKIELVPKTNRMEAEAIVKELENLLHKGFSGSVGIITPHTNQQKLIFSEVRKHPKQSEMEKKFNLKIMTFDTCQGEERDKVIYSMVAHTGADSLVGVFPKDMSDYNLEEEGKLKAQRLNVGFSRAKEQMHFFLSKPIAEFTGEIGIALQHYLNELEIAKKQKSPEETDPNSVMEKKVLEWFYNTKFWHDNHGKINLHPQFELGRYLKQMDPSYHHPFYRVDFLMLFGTEREEQKIIIEYDGFREHFNDLLAVTSTNYEDYYKEADIYRQKVLESYGYKFIRINRFNMGKEPVEELNIRLNEIVKGSNKLTFNEIIKKKVAGVQNNAMRVCTKCNKTLGIESFKDDRLNSGYSKVCNKCKGRKYSEKTEKSISNKAHDFSEGDHCPNCGPGHLVVRIGRFGAFLGCDQYPICRFTKNLK